MEVLYIPKSVKSTAASTQTTKMLHVHGINRLVLMDVYGNIII